MTADLFEPYLLALATLLERLGRDHALTADALLYQQRLQENIERTRRYGDNENRRSERSEIIESLNRLCRDALSVDFNTLVRQAQVRLGQDDARERPKPFEPQTVPIPAGPFLMGSADPAAPAAEQPQHSVDLPDFRIGKYPVTNRQYAAFIRRAKAQDMPKDAGWFLREPPADRLDHPVTGVSWGDAVAYGRWLSSQTGRHYRLPMEAEWEKAARGTDGRLYPWGPNWDPIRCNAASAATTPVTAHPAGASPYGCEDMLGNVQEWTSTAWGSGRDAPDYPYPYRADDGREETDADHAGQALLRLHRGGSYRSQGETLRSTARGLSAPDSKVPWRGFRVAMTI